MRRPHWMGRLATFSAQVRLESTSKTLLYQKSNKHNLEKHDHHKFPACLTGWRKSGKISSTASILLTSDREDVKKEIRGKLEASGFKVIMLEDSATHVMQAPESELKVHKTIAEFHLISKCSHALLTASSLFG